MNVPATFTLFRLLFNPTQCLPQATVPTFNQLPVPLNEVFDDPRFWKNGKKPDIRGVVLDKDNCFAYPKENVVKAEYEAKFRALRAAFPNSLLIVSNSSGLTRRDPTGAQARALSAAVTATAAGGGTADGTRPSPKASGAADAAIPVLQHASPKPGCADEIMAWFRAHPESGVQHAGQVAVVGDRLLTDVALGNGAGMWTVWISEGTGGLRGAEMVFAGLEKRIAAFLLRRGYEAPVPTSPFE